VVPQRVCPILSAMVFQLMARNIWG
jgi:hypothetical protein